MVSDHVMRTRPTPPAGLSPAELEVWNSPGWAHFTAADGEPTDIAAAESWGEHRTIDAGFLTDLLTGEALPPVGLYITGAHISGPLILAGAQIACPIRLQDCFLDHQLDLTNARTVSVDLSGSRIHYGVEATWWHADGSALMRDCILGALELEWADLAGLLDLTEAVVDKLARLSYLEVAESRLTCALFADGLEMSGAHISGTLDMGGVQLRGGRVALRAERIRVGGDLRAPTVVNQPFMADGEIYLHGAEIGGSVSITGGRLQGSARRQALTAPRLHCSGDLSITGSDVTGGLYLEGATIGGSLDASAVTVTVEGSLPAIVAPALSIKKDLELREAKIKGALYLPDLSAAGVTDLTDAHVGGMVYLDRAQLGELNLRLDSEPAEVFIRNVVVSHFVDDSGTWPEPGRLHMNGLSYKSMESPRDSTARLRWLMLSGRYDPHGHDVLAAMYRAQGYPEAAREVAITKQRRRRERPGWRGLPSRMWSWFLRNSVGYGYAPGRVFGWLIGLWLIGALAFAGPFRQSMVVADPSKPHAAFNSVLYVLDLLIPVASLGVRGAWLATGLAQWAAVVLTAAGWLLGLTLVTALSGALKKD